MKMCCKPGVVTTGKDDDTIHKALNKNLHLHFKVKLASNNSWFQKCECVKSQWCGQTWRQTDDTDP